MTESDDMSRYSEDSLEYFFSPLLRVREYEENEIETRSWGQQIPDTPYVTRAPNLVASSSDDHKISLYPFKWRPSALEVRDGVDSDDEEGKVQSGTVSDVSDSNDSDMDPSSSLNIDEFAL
jgi:hypothetical protein